ncbi:STAS domain-containing protein [Catenovulum sediminis]|uniref:STAS domain-containing protein n=1 Tax=Catenovulum sediminis TaxID=1740262 RepID=A0ABV1RN18_9ALTE
MKDLDITTFMTENFAQIISLWQSKLEKILGQRLGNAPSIQLERHCKGLLESFIGTLTIKDNDHAEAELITLLTEVGTIWARKGLSASETSNFILTLKEALNSNVFEVYGDSDAQAFQMILEWQQRLDQLLMICHQAYTNSREKLIKQQNAALLELSSPVVKMWDQILLVPLIGVIDTVRARQITESLLTEITKQESTVAVMDLTGVPVFDTAVAGHLIKTVNAAHMLGCKVILTGISAEGALVLTKLGVEFKQVLTRGNLHSGVQAAFALKGLSVTLKSVA